MRRLTDELWDIVNKSSRPAAVSGAAGMIAQLESNLASSSVI